MLMVVPDGLGGSVMRGRRPEALRIGRRDQDVLDTVAHRGSLPWFRVQRAKIVLAIAAGERQCSVAARLECDAASVWRACQRYRQGGLASLFADDRQGNAGHPQQLSPVQRAQIVELACLESIAQGLHITHWSSADLARQAVADRIIPAISPATVRRILHDVDLQPHRTRYWTRKGDADLFRCGPRSAMRRGSLRVKRSTPGCRLRPGTRRQSAV
jgi:transposase